MLVSHFLLSLFLSSHLFTFSLQMWTFILGTNQSERMDEPKDKEEKRKIECTVANRDGPRLPEVDEAVKAQQRDPTGGRGFNGTISRTLEESRERAKREMVESAV